VVGQVVIDGPLVAEGGSRPLFEAAVPNSGDPVADRIGGTTPRARERAGHDVVALAILHAQAEVRAAGGARQIGKQPLSQSPPSMDWMA
jgi:hypothetical protein